MTVETLVQVETDLLELLKTDRSRWGQIATLMMKVQDEKLYEGSFSRWVSGLAEKAGVHESLLWARLKAGRTYSAYLQTAKRPEAPDLIEGKISAETLVYIDKLAGPDATARAKMVEEALSGGLTRKTLAIAWKEKRAREGARRSRHSLVAKHLGADSAAVLTADEIRKSLTTPDAYDVWLPTLSDANRENSAWLNVPTIAQHFFEFPVRTGSTRSARRLDVCVIENRTTNDIRRAVLHGIEIKVSESDLKGDHKMHEYEPFVDHCWLAVPTVMLDAAVSAVPDGSPWGILLVSPAGVTVARQAGFREGARRAESLETIAILLADIARTVNAKDKD